jgi:hypothetical protein
VPGVELALGAGDTTADRAAWVSVTAGSAATAPIDRSLGIA